MRIFEPSVIVTRVLNQSEFLTKIKQFKAAEKLSFIFLGFNFETKVGRNSPAYVTKDDSRRTKVFTIRAFLSREIIPEYSEYRFDRLVISIKT